MLLRVSRGLAIRRVAWLLRITGRRALLIVGLVGISRLLAVSGGLAIGLLLGGIQRIARLLLIVRRVRVSRLGLLLLRITGGLAVWLLRVLGVTRRSLLLGRGLRRLLSRGLRGGRVGRWGHLRWGIRRCRGRGLPYRILDRRPGRSAVRFGLLLGNHNGGNRRSRRRSIRRRGGG